MLNNRITRTTYSIRKAAENIQVGDVDAAFNLVTSAQEDLIIGMVDDL